jgi:hypothetical protein
LGVGSRDFSNSSIVQHVMPLPVDDSASPPAAEPAGKARWQQELGAIRTNWT